LSRPHINYFKNKLEVGDFPLSWDGVGIDTDGFTINADHRLHAIAETGITTKLIVVTDMDPRMRFIGDQRLRVRTHGHALNMVGARSLSSDMAGTIKLLDAIDRNAVLGANQTSSLTNEQVVELYNRNPELDEAVRIGKSLYRSGVPALHGPTRLYAVEYFRHHNENPILADEHYAALIAGGDEGHMPALELRTRLEDGRDTYTKSSLGLYFNWFEIAWEEARANARSRRFRRVA